MTSVTDRSALLSLMFIGMLTLPPSARGQDLPPAEELIAGYVEAIGGREAHTAPESVRSVGVIQMPAMGITGEFEVLQLAPNRTLTRVILPGVGEIVSGFDGEVGWNVNPLTGAMLMQGAELDEARERASVLASLRDASLVPQRETVELTEYDGESCWRVRLVWVSGRESFDCYSSENGFLVASEDSQTSPMGMIQVTTRFSDYQPFEDMILPMRLVQTSMGQTQEMLVREVQLGVVEPTDVALPPVIQTLLEDPND